LYIVFSEADVKRLFLLRQRSGIWYVKFAWDEEWHSTGERKRALADIEIQRRIREHEKAPAPPTRKTCPTLRDFAADFFEWDRCSWIRRQVAKGRPCSRQYVYGRRKHLTKYIVPKFGDTPLDALHRPTIETWAISLELANWTKTQILYTFRIVLQEAVEMGHLERNPLERLEPFGRDDRARDVLSLDELQLLFPRGEADRLRIWGDRKSATLFLLTATAGMRSGEARAVQWRQILWAHEAILVDRAVKGNGRDEYIGPTKTGVSRVVLLPPRTMTELETWRQECGDPQSISFLTPPGCNVHSGCTLAKKKSKKNSCKAILKVL
jgi:hypothetical protein